MRDRKKNRPQRVTLFIHNKEWNRLTFGVEKVSVDTLNNVSNNWGIGYPICGDTIAKMKEERK